MWDKLTIFSGDLEMLDRLTMHTAGHLSNAYVSPMRDTLNYGLTYYTQS